MGDLWALVNSLIGDETSALYRARTPGRLSLSERVAIDQLNALMLLNLNLIRAAGDKSAAGKFEPLRSYPGSPFDPAPAQALFSPGAALGGYQRMSREQTVEWLRGRGLPVPKGA